jgi:hypothetical protein
MKNLVIPIGGNSSRFPTTKPKYLLTHPLGNLMITESIRGIKPHTFDKVIIIGIEFYENQFKFKDAIIKEFEENLGIKKENILFPLIKSTNNQPETVYNGIKDLNLEGSILIKDCDNYFELNEIGEHNLICVGDLHKLGQINASNKSYVNIGNKNTIVNIVEKEVIGNLFSCGGYGFESAKVFCDYYEKLASNENLYLSHVIYKMILDGYTFIAEETLNYIDWGTMEDWTNYIRQFKTIFVDLDGVLVENSSKHFNPKWGDTKEIPYNVRIINNLFTSKKANIVITTSRSDKCRIETINQLDKLGIKYHTLLMGLPHSQRILINDYYLTNPYPTAIAINLRRNSTELGDKIKRLL